jgi:carbohydrate-selective porin OprB
VFGSRFAEVAILADPSAAKPDYEQVIEACYTIMVSESLNLQPDLQYISHTGGSAAERDALVFLIRVNASY